MERVQVSLQTNPPADICPEKKTRRPKLVSEFRGESCWVFSRRPYFFFGIRIKKYSESRSCTNQKQQKDTTSSLNDAWRPKFLHVFWPSHAPVTSPVEGGSQCHHHPQNSDVERKLQSSNTLFSRTELNQGVPILCALCSSLPLLARISLSGFQCMIATHHRNPSDRVCPD